MNMARSKCITNRTVDVSGETKQMPRVYPLHFPEKAMAPAEWIALGWTPPAKGRWGVLGVGTNVEPPLGIRTHPRKAVIGYHDKRVRSTPRLKHLPRLAYQFTHAELVPRNYYRPEFYPSGARSYFSLQGMEL